MSTVTWLRCWRLLGSTEDLEASLQRLVDLAVRLFPPGYEASITVLEHEDRAETIAATAQTCSRWTGPSTTPTAAPA